MPNGDVAMGELDEYTGKVSIPDDFTDEGKSFTFKYNPDNGSINFRRVFDSSDDEREEEENNKDYIKEMNWRKYWNPKWEYDILNHGPHYA